MLTVSNILLTNRDRAIEIIDQSCLNCDANEDLVKQNVMLFREWFLQYIEREPDYNILGESLYVENVKLFKFLLEYQNAIKSQTRDEERELLETFLEIGTSVKDLLTKEKLIDAVKYFMPDRSQLEILLAMNIYTMEDAIRFYHHAMYYVIHKSQSIYLNLFLLVGYFKFLLESHAEFRLVETVDWISIVTTLMNWSMKNYFANVCGWEPYNSFAQSLKHNPLCNYIKRNSIFTNVLLYKDIQNQEIYSKLNKATNLFLNSAKADTFLALDVDFLKSLNPWIFCWHLNLVFSQVNPWIVFIMLSLRFPKDESNLVFNSVESFASRQGIIPADDVKVLCLQILKLMQQFHGDKLGNLKSKVNRVVTL